MLKTQEIKTEDIRPNNLNNLDTDIDIDEELRSYLPPLTDMEYKKLKDSIRREGLQDPLIIWEEENILVDGHHRLLACQELGIEPEVEYKSFLLKSQVKAWIVDKQLSRRNLTPEQKNYYIGKKYNQEKVTKSEAGSMKGKSIRQNDGSSQTAKKIAEDLKVGTRTVERAGKFTEAVDVITENVDENFRNKILSREIDISQKDIKKIADKYDPEEQQIIIDKIESGEASSYVDARRQLKKEKRPEVELPNTDDKNYRVIYADPPWKYNDKLPSEKYGGAENHYPTMTIPELCELPINDLSTDDAVLFLWTTSPLLEDSFKIVNAWGFRYKTSFVWDKVKHNMGHYNSVRHEFLLICTKGSCTPDNVKLFDSVQEIERGKHSEKPEKFREIIDTLYTKGRKIELFARENPEGWDIWGNEPNIRWGN